MENDLSPCHASSSSEVSPPPLPSESSEVSRSSVSGCVPVAPSGITGLFVTVSVVFVTITVIPAGGIASIFLDVYYYIMANMA
jgi:hypothetical protein